MNLTKEVKGLYNDSYKQLKKEIEEDIKRWNNLLSSCIGRINIAKVAILPQTVYMFQAISI
jgi:hypothetical protein